MVRDEFLGAAGASGGGGGGGGPSSLLFFNVCPFSGGSSATTYIGTLSWNNISGFAAAMSYTLITAAPPSTQGATVPISTPDKTAIAFAHPATPYVYAYSVTTNISTKFANPATLPTGSLIPASAAGSGQYHAACKFSPSGQAVVFAGGNGQKILGYRWSASGFGTQYTSPTTLPSGDVYEIAFTPDGSAIAVTSSSTSPYIHAYAWNDTTGFGTKYANPAVLPSANQYSVDFHPDGNAVLVGSFGGTAYKWSSSGFGTKYAAQVGGPFSDSSGGAYDTAKFSPTGGAVAAFKGNSTLLGLSVSSWNYTTGFGTTFTNPSGVQTAKLGGGAFTGDGTALAWAYETTNGSGAPVSAVVAYSWNDTTGFGTKYGPVTYNPAATLFVGRINAISFN